MELELECSIAIQEMRKRVDDLRKCEGLCYKKTLLDTKISNNVPSLLTYNKYVSDRQNKLSEMCTWCPHLDEGINIGIIQYILFVKECIKPELVQNI